MNGTTTGWARFENGSWFAYPDLVRSSRTELPWHVRDPLASSVTGRGALVAILSAVISKDSRIWLPSYYCPSVREAIAKLFNNCVYTYWDHPREHKHELPAAHLRAGDIIIVQNLFGLRGAPSYDVSEYEHVTIIEDHTHDPWSEWATETHARFAFASLRKTLPLTDGAIVWSRTDTDQLPLPHNRPEVIAAIGYFLVAMQLKREYLSGSQYVGVDSYRAAEKLTKRMLDRVPQGPMTAVSRDLLVSLPISEWREQRFRNWSALASVLRSEGLDVLMPHGSDNVPYGVVVDFHDADTPTALRNALQRRRIWPSILWPGAGDNEVRAFVDEHLVFHVDHRYTIDQMRHVGHITLDALAKSRSYQLSYHLH